jgi:hypothetical protein
LFVFIGSDDHLHGDRLLSSTEASLHEKTGDPVRIGVGGGATVLEVTITLVADLTGNTDGGTTVGDTPGELINGTSLVAAGEAELVTLAVDGNVLLVAALELLDGSLDVLHATLLAHLLGGEVAVQTGTVPVTGDGLGVDGDLGAKVLGDAVEEEAGGPEVVTHLDALAGADLELPLGRHDLGVSAGDVDAGVQAGLVVSVDNVALDDLASAYTAVVGALGSRETTRGPAVRPIVGVEEGVLLLKTEPGLAVSVQLHDLLALMAVVELVGGAVGVPALGEDDDIGGTAERIGEDGDGPQVDVGVVTGGLAGGRAVKVPDGELIRGVGLVLESLVMERVKSAGCTKKGTWFVMSMWVCCLVFGDGRVMARLGLDRRGRERAPAPKRHTQKPSLAIGQNPAHAGGSQKEGGFLD